MGPSTLAPRQLHLTKEDKNALQQMGDDLRNEIVGYYEELLLRDQRVVDPTRWKHVRSDGDVSAYRETKQAIERRERKVSSRFPQAEMVSRSKLSRVMLFGTIPGTVDDAMLAYAFHDSPSLRTHSTYQRDVFRDLAVLSTIHEPTDEDPFRFSGVTWRVKVFAPVVVRNREALTFTELRLSELSNGERVGIHLNHAILHNDLREDSSAVRVEVSLGMVVRQLNESQVEVFMMDYFDAKGALPESYQVNELGKMLLPVRECSETALNMKLCELMVRRSRARIARQRSATLMEIETATNECHCCSRRLAGLFTSSNKCQLCDKLACGRCVRKRDLVVDAAVPAGVIVKPFDFCVACVLRTKSQPSIGVAHRTLLARRELEQQRSRRAEQNESPTVSTSSSRG